jgi:hypothetical protein
MRTRELRIRIHPTRVQAIRARRTPERTQERATRDRIRTLRIPAQTPELRRRRPDLRIEQGDKSKRTLRMRKKLNVDRSDEKGGPEWARLLGFEEPAFGALPTLECTLRAAQFVSRKIEG